MADMNFNDLVEALKGKGPGDFIREGQQAVLGGVQAGQEAKRKAFEEKMKTFMAGDLGDALPAGMDPKRPLSENAFLTLRKPPAGAVTPEEAALRRQVINETRAKLGLPPLPEDAVIGEKTGNMVLRGSGIISTSPEVTTQKKTMAQAVAELPAIRDVAFAVQAAVKAWRPEFTGPGDVATKETLARFGAANPGYTEMAQAIATAFNTIAKRQSGAVINQEELKRLADQFPKQWRSDTDFVSRMNSWINQFNRVVDKNAELAGSKELYAGFKVPLIQAPQQPAPAPAAQPEAGLPTLDAIRAERERRAKGGQ